MRLTGAPVRIELQRSLVCLVIGFQRTLKVMQKSETFDLSVMTMFSVWDVCGQKHKPMSYVAGCVHTRAVRCYHMDGETKFALCGIST